MRKIPNGDYPHWDEYLTNWPQVDGEVNCDEWLQWYEEWQDWPESKLNDGDRLLIECLAFGMTREEIIDKFNAETTLGMNVEQFNGSCQYLFDSAFRFGIFKGTGHTLNFPDMRGFAQSVGTIICESSTAAITIEEDAEDVMTDEEIVAFFKDKREKSTNR